MTGRAKSVTSGNAPRLPKSAPLLADVLAPHAEAVRLIMRGFDCYIGPSLAEAIAWEIASGGQCAATLEQMAWQSETERLFNSGAARSMSRAEDMAALSLGLSVYTCRSRRRRSKKRRKASGRRSATAA